MFYIILTAELLQKNDNFLLKKTLEHHFNGVKLLLFNLFPLIDFVCTTAKEIYPINEKEKKRQQ